ncbi:MAG: hypothetical protein KBC81_03870, partial [Candidatus Pacebacteria bacterium]|nr:hypothetical protein [Candidatus Paceibacterota bacterium]
HKDSLFIGLCLLLTAGIGHNVGRIYAMHTTPSTEQQTKTQSGVPTRSTNIKITTPSPKPTDQRVVASKASNSKLYHHTWCSGSKRIKESNKIWFDSATIAEASGYTIASNCTP